jgi:hypothetical protein
MPLCNVPMWLRVRHQTTKLQECKTNRFTLNKVSVFCLELAVCIVLLIPHRHAREADGFAVRLMPQNNFRREITNTGRRAGFVVDTRISHFLIVWSSFMRQWTEISLLLSQLQWTALWVTHGKCRWSLVIWILCLGVLLKNTDLFLPEFI